MGGEFAVPMVGGGGKHGGSSLSPWWGVGGTWGKFAREVPHPWQEYIREGECPTSRNTLCKVT